MPDRAMLKLQNITKEFSGVEVLHGIEFETNKGEVHALVGENGAGKSTLMKILSGVYPYGQYGGEIYLNGNPVRFNSIRDAENAGVVIVAQELELVLHLPVYENVYLGNPIVRRGLVDTIAMINGTKEIFAHLGVSIDPEMMVENLGVGHRQMIAIAKALRADAGILIFDEPTAALSDSEAEKLFNVINELRQKGITIIYISHRLKEVLKISDKVTVLRDGETVITKNTSDLDENQLVSYMIGRELNEQFPGRSSPIGEPIFEVRDFSAYDDAGKEIVSGINFEVRSGEILGIAGLVGAGRSELVRAIFGVMKKKGTVKLCGKELKIEKPIDAIRAGIGLVSEDRKLDGLVPMLSLADNIALASLGELSKHGIVDNNSFVESAESYRSKLAIKSNNIYQAVENLSGGNQQKVCIAKFLLTSPKVLILDEPTRGVDVGAKYEIYVLLNQLVEKGIAVIIVSSELPEVLGMSDRIMVMSSGRQRAVLNTAESDQETVMRYATIEGA